MLQPSTKIVHQNTGVSSVFADEKLELSVVVQDLQLDSGSGRTLADELRGSSPAGLFPGNCRVTPPLRSQVPRSARQTRVSMITTAMMDDPDDLLTMNRQGELNKRSSWILPLLYAVVFVLRLTGPHVSLPHAHPQFASILAPGKSFYFLLIPVYISNLALVIASFTPILRGTSIIQSGVSFLFPIIIILEYVWQWLMAKSQKIADAMTLIIINFILSTMLLLSVHQRRKRDLHKLWLAEDRFTRKLRDFWLIELPCTIQASWTFLLCLVTANYSSVAGILKDSEGGTIDLRIVAGRQMSTAVISLCLLGIATTVGFSVQRRGVAAVAFVATWAAFDFASSVSRVPDVVASPQLGWIDPKIDIPALQGGCNLIGTLSCIALFGSTCFHGFECVKEWRRLRGGTSRSKGFPIFPHMDTTKGPSGHRITQNDGPQSSVSGGGGGARRAAGISAMKRRPSEFLMRSDSSMTEDETPSVKKKMEMA